MTAWTKDRFADRAEAARALAERVAVHLGTSAVESRPLVVALPRGGAPIAARVAEVIGGELDVLVVRKIAAPGQPEYGVGALTDDGVATFDRAALDRLGLAEPDLAGTVERERAEAARRLRRYRGDRPATDVRNRVVVVVDDGLATGSTMRAAVTAVRHGRPAAVVVAVPVGSRDTCARLAGEVDEVVCLTKPRAFTAVGQAYVDFSPTSDDEVRRALTEVSG